MANKIKSFGIVVILLLVILNIAFADCDSHYVQFNTVITLSQSRACGNDAVGIYISNLPDCNGYNLTVTNYTSYGPILCPPMEIKGGQAACYFKAPDEVVENREIWANVLNLDGHIINGKSALINLTKRPVFKQCFDKFGALIQNGGCNDSCTDNPTLQKWQNVSAISLPMHFTFGLYETAGTAYNSLNIIKDNAVVHSVLNVDNNQSYKVINCGPITSANCHCTTCEQTSNGKLWTSNDEVLKNVFGSPPSWTGVYQCSGNTYAPPNIFNSTGQPIVTAPGATDYPYNESGCKGPLGCSFETHTMIRYQYEWNMSYDLITTAYSKTDYVPMFVGYNQTEADSSGVGQAVSGGCTGNNLCYTEVPLCGDGKCDVTGGENCNTCPVDCFKTASTTNPKENGDCIANGCTSCLSSDTKFADARGCVLNYKKEGDDCDCKDQCKEQDKELQCTWDTAQGTKLAPRGKCCPTNEVWNGTDCIMYRQIVLTDVKFEFKSVKESPTMSTSVIKAICCDVGADQTWVKVTYTFLNKGILPETIKVTSYFDEETQSRGLWGNNGWGGTAYADEHDVTIPGGGINTKTVSFHKCCVRTSGAMCNKVHNGVNYDFTEKPSGNNAPSLTIQFKSTTPDLHFKYDKLGKLNLQAVICDTTTRACLKTDEDGPNPSGLPITFSNGNYGAVCGGRDFGWGGKVPNPFLLVTCCDPFQC